MKSNPGLHKLDANYSGSNGGSSCLNIYELYQIEQYEGQELFEFEQYVKIIQFAGAVRSGTHPRVKTLPQPDTPAYDTLTALKTPRHEDTDSVKIGLVEADTANDLNPTQGKFSPYRRFLPRNFYIDRNHFTGIESNVGGSTKRAAGTSVEIVGVERIAEFSWMLAITPIEKVEDISQRNQLVTVGSSQELSATNPDHVEGQRQATQDQATQKLREQKIDIEKQIDAHRAAVQCVAMQRAAVQRSLGPDKAPPTSPRIPLSMAPRVMTRPFLNTSAATSLLNSRLQTGLNVCSPLVLGELVKARGSALQLLGSSKQSLAKKKQRVGDKEDKDYCGKKERGSTSEVWSSRSNSAKGNGGEDEGERVIECEGKVKEDRTEIGGFRENFELLKIDRGIDLGRGEAEINFKGKNGGKKRKRNSLCLTKAKSAT